MSVYVLNWPNLLCQIVCKWQTPLEELCKKLQIRFRISDTSAGYSNQNGEDMLKMIMDRWSQMKTDFDIIDLQLYIASFGPEVWIFPMFQIEIWQMAGSFWLFKSPLHFHFKLYKISDFLLLNKFFLILLLAPDRQSYNNPTQQSYSAGSRILHGGNGPDMMRVSFGPHVWMFPIFLNNCQTLLLHHKMASEL